MVTLSLDATQNEDPANDFSTPTVTTAIAIETTQLPESTNGCDPAPLEYLGAIWQLVEYTDTDIDMETGWVTESREIDGLVFVAARIYGPGFAAGKTLPGVWGIFDYSGGYFDIYAINEIAQEFSDTDWGEDFEPVITMQTDGAQAAYDCGLTAP